MAVFKSYSIANDTLNGALNDGALHTQLSADSTIGFLFDGITRDQGSDNFNIYLTVEITAPLESAIDAVVAAHDGVEIPDIQTVDFLEKSAIQKAMPVIVYKPEVESFARATHDFCNKTTWYTKSTRVDGEVLTNPTGLTYSCANTHLIDVVNGVVNRQDTLQEYAVKVYDGGSEITGYTVNHAAGEITLDAAPTGALTVDYSHATTSEWVLEPEAGSVLIIEHSEVQFATDVQMNTPLRFEIWVGNPYFGIEGHPYELLEKLPYQNVQYNSIKDLVNEANLGTGTIPAIDDLPECVVFPFNYASIKPFKSSDGAELRIRSVGDLELTGSFGTATFYLLKKDDV